MSEYNDKDTAEQWLIENEPDYKQPDESEDIYMQGEKYITSRTLDFVEFAEIYGYQLDNEFCHDGDYYSIDYI